MLALNYTQEILNLQDVEVEKVEIFEKAQRIHIKPGRKVVNCPCCETETSKIHDYRTQIVKDCEAFGKKIELVLKKEDTFVRIAEKDLQNPMLLSPNTIV